ncbi:hypothetical protein B0H11DRAFT_1912674 [Mycena galericulata]|nr:hypothetical protein B0H11DRAFT_1912674 [Mycena galericulata]
MVTGCRLAVRRSRSNPEWSGKHHAGLRRYPRLCLGTSHAVALSRIDLFWSSRNRSTNILHNMENLSKGSHVALFRSHEIIELNKNITSGTGNAGRGEEYDYKDPNKLLQIQILSQLFPVLHLKLYDDFSSFMISAPWNLTRSVIYVDFKKVPSPIKIW